MTETGMSPALQAMLAKSAAEGGGDIKTPDAMLKSITAVLFGCGVSLKQGESNPLSLANAAPLKGMVGGGGLSLFDIRAGLIPIPDFKKYVVRDMTDHSTITDHSKIDDHTGGISGHGLVAAANINSGSNEIG